VMELLALRLWLLLRFGIFLIVHETILELRSRRESLSGSRDGNSISGLRWDAGFLSTFLVLTDHRHEGRSRLVLPRQYFPAERANAVLASLRRPEFRPPCRDNSMV
jgi:hypothetical protein